jgi:hypothetical protein
MSCENPKDCLFRQLQDSPDRVPESMASAVGVLAEVGDEPTASETAEAFAALEAPACPVDGCRVSIDGLLKYVTSAGADAPRESLDQVVAPSCALLDIPHDIDTQLGSFGGE